MTERCAWIGISSGSGPWTSHGYPSAPEPLPNYERSKTECAVWRLPLGRARPRARQEGWSALLPEVWAGDHGILATTTVSGKRGQNEADLRLVYYAGAGAESPEKSAPEPVAPPAKQVRWMGVQFEGDPPAGFESWFMWIQKGLYVGVIVRSAHAEPSDECLCARKLNGDIIETHLACPVHGALKSGEQP